MVKTTLKDKKGERKGQGRGGFIHVPGHHRGKTGEVQRGRLQNTRTFGQLHADLVYLTRSFPVPSQKHGL